MEQEPNNTHTSTQDTKLTLLKAVELGEYDPDILCRWPEWSQLSKHGQFQLVRKGLVNRDIQLRSSWAEINNQLNFSKKPYLHTALENVQKEIETLRDEEDRLFVEYTR